MVSAQKNQQIEAIDAHCHLDFPWFESDQKEVIGRAQSKLQAVVTSTVRGGNYAKSIQLHEDFPDFVYTCLGHEPQKILELNLDQIISAISKFRNQIVALGEIGLDYYWVKDPQIQEAQRTTLIQYLDYAKEEHLPIVIHSRKAEIDCVNIIESHHMPRVYFHCFDGDASLIDRITQHSNWMIGVATNVVYRKRTQQLALNIPLDHLLIETDSPFLHPFQRRERNEPVNVTHVAHKISDLQNIPWEEVVERSTLNATRFYSIK